jgi:anti-sigma-K factor RskA
VTVDTPLSEEHEALAAELALGVLAGADRAEALRQVLANPAFAGEVDAWRARLAPLLDTVAQAAPSPRVWNTIDARTRADQPDPVTFAQPVDRNSLRRWRTGALVSGAIAASLALVLAVRPPGTGETQPAPSTIAVSQLSAGAEGPTMTVAYDPHKGVLRIGPASLEPSAKVPELWVIPEDGVPRSLGIVAAGGGTVGVDAGLRRFLGDGATLAITLEDAASAPHKAPSAKPVMVGKFSII